MIFRNSPVIYVVSDMLAQSSFIDKTNTHILIIYVLMYIFLFLNFVKCTYMYYDLVLKALQVLVIILSCALFVTLVNGETEL